jgi:hypothetical protein
MPLPRKNLMRRRLRQLIEEWEPIDGLIATKEYSRYSLGFPDARPDEIETIYNMIRTIAEKFGCSILVAEIALLELWSEYTDQIGDRLILLEILSRRKSRKPGPRPLGGRRQRR